jgi:hypothetical protein
VSSPWVDLRDGAWEDRRQVEGHSLVRMLVVSALLAFSLAAPARGQTVGPGGERTGPLNLYYNADTKVYEVANQALTSAWAFQRSFGFMLSEPGADRRAVYRCVEAGRYFPSLSPTCGSQTVVGTMGYLLTAQVGDSLPVYRCNVPGLSGHAATNDPTTCHGLGSVESLLGYAPQRQRALNRYQNGDHWETARGVGAGYRFEYTLGYVLDAPDGDRTALSSCLAGADHFLARSCAGATVVGAEGYVFTRDRGAGTRALYACRVGADRFTSTDPACEGKAPEGLLGYAMVHPVDDDLDGYAPGLDCNDADAATNPGGVELAGNAIDENCDGIAVPGVLPGSADRDGDGVLAHADCEDTRADIAPGKPDVPRDGVDQNCDGRDADFARLATRITAELRAARVTVFAALRLRDAVAGSTVRITCRGRGCPRGLPSQTRVTRTQAQRSILGRLAGARLRPGAVVEVRVTAPETIGRVARWRIRAGKAPKKAELCLAPGAAKPADC